MGKVIAVCTSERKGIQKTSVPEIKVIEDWGIEGDAHAGKWHRQVSLLSFDKIEDFRARGAEVEDGALIHIGEDMAMPVGEATEKSTFFQSLFFTERPHDYLELLP